MAAATDAWPEPRWDWRERTADEDGDPPARDDGAIPGPERADAAPEPNPHPPDGYEPI